MSGMPASRLQYQALINALERAPGNELSPEEVRQVLQIADKRNLGRAMLRPIELGICHRVGRGSRCFYRAGVDPAVEVQDLGDFNAVLYLDGTLNMSGVPLDDDGDPLLTPAMARALKALLNGSNL
jgi:hypothetical protein